MKKIVVLGSGLVGGPMAIDLAKDKNFKVTVVDIDALALARVKKAKGVTAIQEDLSDPKIVRRIVQKHDMVVSAVPGFMGFRTLQAILEAGKTVVDIAFFPEDAF